MFSTIGAFAELSSSLANTKIMVTDFIIAHFNQLFVDVLTQRD